MASADVLHRFLFDNTDIRGEVVNLTDSYGEILKHNNYPDVIEQLLGEFISAVAILSSTLKFDGMITLQAKGEGPLPAIMAECSHNAGLRAIARPNEDTNWNALSGANLRELLGSNGLIAITIEPDKGERYQGLVGLEADTLADCLASYFERSEQLPTKFWLNAEPGKAAAGLMLQALPQQIETSKEAAEDRWNTAVALADTIKPEEIFELEHEQLLFRLFHELNVRMFDPQALKFECSCSFERSAKALKSLGRSELDSLLEERGKIEIDCQFCNQIYSFAKQDIDTIFAEDQLH